MPMCLVVAATMSVISGIMGLGVDISEQGLVFEVDRKLQYAID